MRRIRDNKENETVDNVHRAYGNFSKQKHNRQNIRDYEASLSEKLDMILEMIINESWQPGEYKEKIIFERKFRKLAKASLDDHVLETASILPYEKALYDYSTWRAPAVKPGLGTHGLFRMLRNELKRHSQWEEIMYYVPLDVHHYFPTMDHEILKIKIDNKVKNGKLRRFLHKVVDSYLQGAPLGIKIAQIFGQIYLADFDRLVMRFFDISKDSDKLAYWTERYITARILTAKSKEDYEDLCRGPQWLAERFRKFVSEGIRHYFRFVDNILILHADKAVVHICLELAILHLSRDYHLTVNKDYNVRPCWEGIRMVGYVFYHDHVLSSKRNKKELAKRVRKLQRKGLSEDEIRVRLASRIGYVKHANSINLFKTLGMEKSLGKIIKNRRVRAPFKGMTGSQKVKFSSIVNTENYGGG